MARKDKGANEESPEPLVSKGTAGEGIDDLGAPIDDEHDVIEDETGQDSTDADSAGAAEADSAASAKSESAKADATAGLDDVPFELAEDTPDPDELPETGLVSEFVDVGNRQASWLVSNRESTAALRSPYFLVTAAVIILGVLAAIVTGIVTDAQKDSGTPSMAMVGVGDQAQMYEQQLGVEITDAEDTTEAEKLVREGKVDAAFIQEPEAAAGEARAGDRGHVCCRPRPSKPMSPLRCCGAWSRSRCSSSARSARGCTRTCDWRSATGSPRSSQPRSRHAPRHRAGSPAP
jgi:ABC-2 type transport system permease protein